MANEKLKSAAASQLSYVEMLQAAGRKATQNFNVQTDEAAAQKRTINDDVQDAILDWQDSREQFGDVVGVAGDIRQQNQTARMATFEPFYIMRVFEVHAPWQYSFNPQLYSFNQNGEITVGILTAASATITGVAAILPGLVGFAVQFNAQDTMSGNSLSQLQKPSTGVNAEFKLTDINSEGTYVCVNHSLDFSRTVVMTDGIINLNNLPVTLTQVDVTVPNQFYFNYNDNGDWVLRGSNSDNYVYPISVTDETVQLIYAITIAGIVAQMPNLLADSFSQVIAGGGR